MKELQYLQINNRWRSILEFMYFRTWVSIHDIQALYIPNLKYARRVLSEMQKRDLIKMVRSPLALNSRGAGVCFYALTKNGFGLTRISKAVFSEVKYPTSINCTHYYLINSVFSAFQMLDKNSNVLIESITEKQLKFKNNFREFCYSKILSDLWSYFAIPDFVISVGNENKKELYLGEIDTGTEIIESIKPFTKTVKRKFESFEIYKQNNVIEYFSDVFNYKFKTFKYLHITLSESRLKEIRYLQPNVTYSILITSFSKINPNPNSSKYQLDNFWKPIWKKLSDRKDLQYFITGEKYE